MATVLVGEDPSSEVYVSNNRRLSLTADIDDHHRRLMISASQKDVPSVLDGLAADDAVSGILLQLPLPQHLDAKPLIDRIPWHQIVDGLTTTSAGLLVRNIEGLRPCTPSGVITLLRDESIELRGASVVVGRSELVGKPLAQLLLQQDATVIVVHSRTTIPADLTSRADVVIAAAGISHLLGREHVAPGAVVIDAGIHRTPQGLIGDVNPVEVSRIASKITPVPGGVGPMTIAELMRNTVKAARLTAKRN